jgi:non-specific serine/threonine protein kinase/serine/threonine-protein kinase
MSSQSGTPASLEIVERIFHAALEVPPDRIDAFVEQSCAGDLGLRHQVEALLKSHRQAGHFIETPLVHPQEALLEAPDSDHLIDQTVGHYRILQRLGAGGMGVVYLARRADQQYEKRVAIKLIKRGMDTESVLRHFHTERQILATFDHPNIAHLLDGGATADGLPYFVMEYVEGVPIDDYCEAQKLSITQRLQLFRQICGAVTYAHRHAVIHRDLKPSNILVGSDGVPKLLDFGIAKILQPGEYRESILTMIGLRMMTPDYASPEQVRGEALTTASDVYSLGVVLYKLLTGNQPYDLPRTSHDISRAITETEPRRPSAVVGKSERWARGLRGDLDNVVLMALRKEPERRYQSVERLSDDIRRHLENLPVLARHDTFGYRATKFVQRNKAATSAAALVALSLLGGIVATSWQAQKAREQEAMATAAKARAEQRFNDVRRLAHSVLFEYYDAIENLPGATAARKCW